MRFRSLPLLAALGVLCAPGAFAQQAEFNPTQCEGRTAQDCNDLMGALNVSPDERQKVLLVRATALLQKHDLEGTIAEYREITVIDRDNLVAYSTLGFLESIGEKWKDAVADLRRAVEIAPAQDRLQAMLAVALAKDGDCDGAKTAFAEAKAKSQDLSNLDAAQQAIGETCR